MDPSPGKCPVTGASSPDKASGCPGHALVSLFEGLRDKVAKVTGDARGFPIIRGNVDRAKLMRFSGEFAILIISLIQELSPIICNRLDRMKKRKTSEVIVQEVFVNILDERTSNRESISQIFLLELAEKRMGASDIKGMPADIESRIMMVYQIGIKNIIRIWQQLLRAYKQKYGRIPTADEIRNIRSFVVEFAHSIGESPQMIANSISGHLIESIEIDEHGVPGFTKNGIGHTEKEVDGALQKRSAAVTLGLLENAVCPALAEIRHIAEASCIVLEECYAHALTK